MSRQIKRAALTVFMAALLVFSACGISFAAGIVSPAEGSILFADSLLVSVKLSDSRPVRITVYKEQTETRAEVLQKDGSIVTEAQRSDADASFLTADDMLLIAEGVRTKEDGSSVLLSDGTALPEYKDEIFFPTVEYVNAAAGIGFYTKKLTNVTPGLYKVVVETPAAGVQPAETVCSYTAVKEQQEEKEGIFVSSQQSGALLFLQSFLKNLFR